MLKRNSLTYVIATSITLRAITYHHQKIKTHREDNLQKSFRSTQTLQVITGTMSKVKDIFHKESIPMVIL